MRFAPVCAIGLASAVAHADTVDLFVFENADNADVSGLSLGVDVVDAGNGAVQFIFTNDSTIPGFVTSIYVESTQFTVAHLDSPEFGPATGDVSFSDRVAPLEPAGSIANYGGAWGGTLFGSTRYNGYANKWAIQTGEALTVNFQLVDASFQELLEALQTPEFRFACHVQGLPNDSSVWATNGPQAQLVPVPSAAFAGAGLLGVIGIRRIARKR